MGLWAASPGIMSVSWVISKTLTWNSLIEKYAPEVATRFVQDHVDAVLLTPG